MIRIRIRDGLGNVSYLHKTSKGWHLTGANGTPYALSNVTNDAMLLTFALEDCGDDADQALAAAKEHIRGHGRSLELVTSTSP